MNKKSSFTISFLNILQSKEKEIELSFEVSMELSLKYVAEFSNKLLQLTAYGGS